MSEYKYPCNLSDEDVYIAAFKLPLSMRTSLAANTIDCVLAPEVNSKSDAGLFSRTRLRASSAVMSSISARLVEMERAERLQAQERNVQIHAIENALVATKLPSGVLLNLQLATQLYEEGVRVPGAAEVGE